MKKQCPLCNGDNTALWSKASDYEYCTTEEEFDYYVCSDCDLLFIAPMPVERLSEIYPPNYYSFKGRSRSFAIRVKEWLDKRWFGSILATIDSKNISALDIGGGTGWLLTVMRRLDKRINKTQVVDIDSAAEQEALAAGHEFYNGKIEDFSTTAHFDVILLLNLIEHIESPQSVLQKIEQILVPGGVVIIKTPNIDSLDARLFCRSYWGGLHCPRHWILFSEHSLRKVISATSLEVESLRYTQGAPFWSWSLLAALARKKIISITRERPAIYHPLNSVLEILFAGFDFIRLPFAKTSQMVIVLRKAK